MAEVAKKPQQQALIGLCGFAGLRVSEALIVRPSHIKLHDNTIMVHGKGDKMRVVPLSATCWRYICSAYLDSEPDDRLLVGYHDRFARKIITTCAERAGLKRHVASHDLRATFATAVFDRTLNLRLVQELLGHSSPDTTQVYTGVTQNALQEAVKL